MNTPVFDTLYEILTQFCWHWPDDFADRTKRYDIEQDSPLWLTLPAAFTDEVSNVFKLYDKSKGRFGLGKAKDFGKFLASSFVPRFLRNPLFKDSSNFPKFQK